MVGVSCHRAGAGSSAPSRASAARLLLLVLCVLSLSALLPFFAPSAPALSSTSPALTMIGRVVLALALLLAVASAQNFGRVGPSLSRPPAFNPLGLAYIPDFGFVVGSQTYGRYASRPPSHRPTVPPLHAPLRSRARVARCCAGRRLSLCRERA